MEKIIKTKLTQYAETNNIINDEQAGFRSKKRHKRQTVPTDTNSDPSKKQKTSLCVRVHGCGKRPWTNTTSHTFSNGSSAASSPTGTHTSK